MKISVSSLNKFNFYPNFEWNKIGSDGKKLKDSERFCVVIQKVNGLLDGGKYSKMKEDKDAEDGMVLEVDRRERLKAHVLKLINPPILDVDEGGSEEVLTVEILVSGCYFSLSPLLTQIFGFINELEEQDLDTGKK